MATGQMIGRVSLVKVQDATSAAISYTFNRYKAATIPAGLDRGKKIG